MSNQLPPINVVYDASTREATFLIDNSSLEKFDTCARSAQHYLSDRIEANEDRPALAFGKIIHKILEERYKFLGTGESVIELLPKLVAVADAEFAKWSPPLDDYRNYGTAISFINEYANQFPYEPFEIAEVCGKPGIEIPFACPLTTIEVNTKFSIWDLERNCIVHDVFITKIHVVWKGKIDIAGRRNGQLFGLDHKTTSMMGPSFFGEFDISGQVYGYAWALQQLTGELPAFFQINGLGIRKPTKTGKAFEFIRYSVNIYPKLIDEWIYDTVFKIKSFLRCAALGYFPKQTKWCNGKYGQCSYKSICSNEDPEMRNVIKTTSAFKTVTWDPLKED